MRQVKERIREVEESDNKKTYKEMMSICLKIETR